MTTTEAILLSRLLQEQTSAYDADTRATWQRIAAKRARNARLERIIAAMKKAGM